MKKVRTTLLIGLIAILGSCSDSPFEDISIFEEIKSGNEVESSRISIVNQKIGLESENENAAFPGFNISSSKAEFNAAEYSCNEEVTNSTNRIQVNNNKTVCIPAGVTFSGSLGIQGGTVVVYGTARPSNIYGSGGTIVIADEGTFTTSNFNVNNRFIIENYGDLSVNNSINISGEITNFGSIEASKIQLNGGGKFQNEGFVSLSNDFQANVSFDNEGTIEVGKNFTINGGAEVDNSCKILIGGDLTVNRTLRINGYVSAEGNITVNGGSLIYLNEQSYLIGENLTLNGRIEGSNDGFARVDIEDRTIINGGGRISGKIDFNDQNGIETNRGTITGEVSRNGNISISKTACNPGTPVVLINPEYTLVADISVPDYNSTNLSATDVTYSDGLAFISYHLNGAEFAGALDVLNLGNINSPSFTYNYKNEAREFNAIRYDSDRIIMAGQRNVDESGFSTNGTQGAVLFTAEIINEDQIEESANWSEIPMPSFSGNSIGMINDNSVLFASGASGGGFFEVNLNSGTITNTIEEDFAKYVQIVDDTKYHLIGGNGNAELNVDQNGVSQTIDLGKSAIPTDGKNVIDIYDGKAYVSLGENGIVVVNLSTNEVVGEYTYEGEGLANGLAVDEDFVYIANGQDGLILVRRQNLEYYGRYKYDGSANLVEIVDNIILIANGTGGVKVLTRDL